MQNKLWLFSIGQHKGKSLNMGIGLTVSQFIFWFKHDCLRMLEHCLNQFWKKMQGAIWDFQLWILYFEVIYKMLVSTSFVFDLLVQAYAKLRKFEITRKNVLLFKPYKFQYFDSCCSKIWSSPSSLEDLWVYDSKKNISKWGNNPNHGKRCSPSVIVNTSLILKN